MYDFLISVGFNVHNDMINCNNKTTFHEIFSFFFNEKIRANCLSKISFFYIIGMLVRKSPRFKKKLLRSN